MLLLILLPQLSPSFSLTASAHREKKIMVNEKWKISRKEKEHFRYQLYRLYVKRIMERPTMMMIIMI